MLTFKKKAWTYNLESHTFVQDYLQSFCILMGLHFNCVNLHNILDNASIILIIFCVCFIGNPCWRWWVTWSWSSSLTWKKYSFIVAIQFHISPHITLVCYKFKWWYSSLFDDHHLLAPCWKHANLLLNATNYLI